MSSGVEAEIALDAAVVASLGMNRLLGVGAGAGAKGAEALASLAEKKAGARADAVAEIERYERALREVVDRNARIMSLAETQRRAVQGHGVTPSVPLPEALPMQGQPYDELVTWCAAVDKALDEAERAISTEIGTLVAKRLEAPKERHEDLARVLSRLLPDTDLGHHERVHKAAERVAKARTEEEAESLLNEVRLRVQEANEHAKAARVRRKEEAEARDREEQAEAERAYILSTVTSAFEDLGYDVDTGFQTVTPGQLVMTRAEWPDQAVRMLLDDSTLRAKMMRTRPPMSEEDRRRDAERERDWCDAFEAAQQRLEREGVGMAITWRLEPGAEQLPLGAESTVTRRKQKPRERTVEY